MEKSILIQTNLRGGFKYSLFSPLSGEDSQFDWYFSNGLKPPTSNMFRSWKRGTTLTDRKSMLPTTMVSRTKCQFWKGCESLHPRKLTCLNPKFTCFFTMGNHLNPTFMFGFHVNLYGCFLTWWYPNFTPQNDPILAGKKPMEIVGETHHFRKPPKTSLLPKARGSPKFMDPIISNASPPQVCPQCGISGSRDQSRMLSDREDEKCICCFIFCRIFDVSSVRK